MLDYSSISRGVWHARLACTFSFHRRQQHHINSNPIKHRDRQHAPGHLFMLLQPARVIECFHSKMATLHACIAAMQPSTSS